MWFRLLTVVGAACCLVACATSRFDTSWKAPEATALQIQGAKVAAIAMMENEAARRVAEDALVRELNQRGAHGVAMYTIVSGASPGNEAEVHAALDGMGFAGAVVMRPVGRRTEVVSDPIYVGPRYSHLWGGYYGYGWSEPSPVAVVGSVRTRTLVSIEVLVYFASPEPACLGRADHYGGLDERGKPGGDDGAAGCQGAPAPGIVTRYLDAVDVGLPVRSAPSFEGPTA